MSTQTVSLKITLRYKDVDEFAKRYAENISSAGLFLRTRTPKPTGSKIRFELLLSDGSHVLRGDGVVVNIRQDEKPGMAIRFNVLDGESWANVEKVVGLHGNGSLAPTPLGAPFRTVAPSAGTSSSRRVRTSLRAGGVGKGTGSVRSPFAGSSAPAGASWSAPPPPREPQASEFEQDAGDESDPKVSTRTSMLARPWATGRQADIDTSEIRTARISQFGTKDDKLEVPAPVDGDVPEETAKLSPAEFLNRASELRKRVATSSQDKISEDDDEEISIAPASPEEEATQLATSLTESGAIDQETESVLSENTASDSDGNSDGHEEFLSSPESEEDELALGTESIADNEASELDSTGSTDEESLDADSLEAQGNEAIEKGKELAAAIDDDDWASAFDDFPDSSLPTKVVTPTDPVPDESFLADLESEGSVDNQENALASTNQRIGSLSEEETVELESGNSTKNDEDLVLSESAASSPESSLLESDDESEYDSDEFLVQGVLENALQEPPEFAQDDHEPETSTSDVTAGESDNAQLAAEVENEDNVVSESPEMNTFASTTEAPQDEQIQEDLAAMVDESRQVPTDFNVADDNAEPFPATNIRLESPDKEQIEQQKTSSENESDEALEEDWSAFAETPEIGDPAAPPLSEVLADVSSVKDDETSSVSESSDSQIAAEEGHGFEESQSESEESAHSEMSFESDLPIDEPVLGQDEGMSEDGALMNQAAGTGLSLEVDAVVSQQSGELDQRAISGSGFDEASENELFKVVDNLFEVDSDEEPLPKLRASVAPDILNSPPLIDEVVEKAVQAERETTGEFVGPSNEAIELASSETNKTLENVLQARSVARDDSDLVENPPADFAMHEAQTNLAHESVSDEELVDGSTRVKTDELNNENPNRLSMDVAGAFEGKNEATVIEGSAEDYLSSLPSPSRIDTIEPPKNLTSEIIPDRPISAETRAEPNQEHWTHSEIERGYSVDISSHIQSSRPAKEATVAIDLGGQWLRVARNQEGALVPIKIEGLTHYPASIGLYENYEVAQGAELLEVEQSASLEIVSIMQLLRVLQGEPYASKEYVGKVRAEANGRCIAELIGKKWNLGDLLRAFFSPVGAAINEELGSSKTWVKLIVPAGTNEQVKSLLLEACEDAGLGVYDFVNDVDAILAGASNAISGFENLVFIDLGHTHLSAHLAVNSQAGWSVLSTAWDGEVSAASIDERVAQSIIAEMSGSWDDLTIGQKDLLSRVASTIRGDLSKESSIRFSIPDQRGLNEQVVTLPRTRAYQSIEEFIDRVIVMVRGLANAASLHPKTLGGIIILGGSSRFQPLLSAITTLTTKQPIIGVNPDLCQVAGALGLSEGAMEGDVSGEKFTLSSAIGVALPGGRFKALIEAGTSLPTEIIRRNPTSKDNQAVFELDLFQGDGATVSECESLGRVVLPGLPKGARGAVFVDLRMKLQKDGVIRVHLSEPHSGEKIEASIATQQTPDETRADIERRNQELGELEAKSKSRKSLLGRLFGR